MDVTPSEEPSRQTIKDKKLDCTLYLRGFAARLSDVCLELSQTALLFPDRSSLNREQNAALVSLRKTIIPFLSTSAEHIKQSASSLSPIAGSCYVHNIDERKRREDAREELRVVSKSKRIRMTSPLKRIENSTKHVLADITNTCKPSSNTSHTRRVQPKNLFNLPTITSSLPPPANRIEYQPLEVLSLITPHPKGSNARSKIISHLLEDKLVPVNRSAVYKLIKKQEDKKEIRSQWNQAGPPRLLKCEDIQEMSLLLTKVSGNSIASDELKAKIQENQTKAAENRGLVPITKIDYEPSRMTLTNYCALVAHEKGVSITDTVIKNTSTRYTAENSLISAMALLSVVACTHYMPAVEWQKDIEEEMKNASDGVLKLFKIMQKFYNNAPLTIVNPALLFSTDDTVQFIFEGKGVGVDQFRLVSSKCLKGSGTRSKYKLSNANNMNGMRVKMTYTFSGAGTGAPIFVTVLGLTERELPHHQCITVSIEGLCVGGGGVTVGNKQKGWLVFMRGETGMDKERYKTYRDKVFIPFVNASRNEFNGWEDGDPITSDLQAISWCDGDLAQIENIVNEESLDIYKKNKIMANKQNPARTGSEQAADLTKTFPIMQSLQQTYTCQNIPTNRHPMKRRVSEVFTKLKKEGRLILKSSKEHSLIDFVSSIPAMSSKAMTFEGITHGFLEGGYIDRQHMRYPDFDKLLATCRTDPTKAEYELCEQMLPELVAKYLEKGHVGDDTFELMGFPADKDESGKVVRRESTVTQEARQICKILTHSHQVEMRAEIAQLILHEKTRKEQDKSDAIKQKIDQNAECERNICNLLNKEDVRSEYFEEITHELLYKIKSDDLKSFILARSKDLPRSRLPKRGKVGDAILGENNLLKLAFDLRSAPNLLLQQKTSETNRYAIDSAPILFHNLITDENNQSNYTHN